MPKLLLVWQVNKFLIKKICSLLTIIILDNLSVVRIKLSDVMIKRFGTIFSAEVIKYHTDGDAHMVDIEESVKCFNIIRESKNDDTKQFGINSKKASHIINALIRLFFMLQNEMRVGVCPRIQTMESILCDLVGTTQMGANVSF